MIIIMYSNILSGILLHLNKYQFDIYNSIYNHITIIPKITQNLLMTSFFLHLTTKTETERYISDYINGTLKSKGIFQAQL